MPSRVEEEDLKNKLERVSRLLDDALENKHKSAENEIEPVFRYERVSKVRSTMENEDPARSTVNDQRSPEASFVGSKRATIIRHPSSQEHLSRSSRYSSRPSNRTEFRTSTLNRLRDLHEEAVRLGRESKEEEEYEIRRVSIARTTRSSSGIRPASPSNIPIAASVESVDVPPRLSSLASSRGNERLASRISESIPDRHSRHATIVERTSDLDFETVTPAESRMLPTPHSSVVRSKSDVDRHHSESIPDRYSRQATIVERTSDLDFETVTLAESRMLPTPHSSVDRSKSDVDRHHSERIPDRHSRQATIVERSSDLDFETVTPAESRMLPTPHSSVDRSKSDVDRHNSERRSTLPVEAIDVISDHSIDSVLPDFQDYPTGVRHSFARDSFRHSTNHNLMEREPSIRRSTRRSYPYGGISSNRIRSKTYSTRPSNRHSQSMQTALPLFENAEIIDLRGQIDELKLITLHFNTWLGDLANQLEVVLNRFEQTTTRLSDALVRSSVNPSHSPSYLQNTFISEFDSLRSELNHLKEVVCRVHETNPNRHSIENGDLHHGGELESFRHSQQRDKRYYPAPHRYKSQSPEYNQSWTKSRYSHRPSDYQRKSSHSHRLFSLLLPDSRRRSSYACDRCKDRDDVSSFTDSHADNDLSKVYYGHCLNSNYSDSKYRHPRRREALHSTSDSNCSCSSSSDSLESN